MQAVARSGVQKTTWNESRKKETSTKSSAPAAGENSKISDDPRLHPTLELDPEKSVQFTVVHIFR